MPHSIRVIRAPDFIRARPDGVVDIEAAEKLLADIAATVKDQKDIEILIDTRRAHAELGAADLWFLAERLVRYGGSFARKTAVLCPLERFDRARFFALCAENKGFNVQAFISYEEAMDWLLGAEGA
ncbi:MAG TPA: hypothetical protein VFC18_06575 [Burkholderiales bacterium]|nr:hypothetical protein [Burkholderiales bacterium]